MTDIVDTMLQALILVILALGTIAAVMIVL